MCGLKASNVREELVSAAVREAEQDFVYGEIKPPPVQVSLPPLRASAWACSQAWRLCGRVSAQLPDESEEQLCAPGSTHDVEWRPPVS